MVSFSGAQIPGSYWLDLRTYDAAATAATLKIPIMIIRGDRDYQVTAADDEGWKKSLKDRNNVFFKLYPGLNHALVKGTGPSLPSEYGRLNHVDAEVIQDIARWVKSLKP